MSQAKSQHSIIKSRSGTSLLILRVLFLKGFIAIFDSLLYLLYKQSVQLEVLTFTEI